MSSDSGSPTEGDNEELEDKPAELRDVGDEWIEDTTGLWEKIQAGQQVRPTQPTPEAEIAKPKAEEEGEETQEGAEGTEVKAKEKKAPKARNYESWEFNFKRH